MSFLMLGLISGFLFGAMMVWIVHEIRVKRAQAIRSLSEAENYKLDCLCRSLETFSQRASHAWSEENQRALVALFEESARGLIDEWYAERMPGAASRESKEDSGVPSWEDVEYWCLVPSGFFEENSKSLNLSGLLLRGFFRRDGAALNLLNRIQDFVSCADHVDTKREVIVKSGWELSSSFESWLNSIADVAGEFSSDLRNTMLRKVLACAKEYHCGLKIRVPRPMDILELAWMKVDEGEGGHVAEIKSWNFIYGDHSRPASIVAGEG